MHSRDTKPFIQPHTETTRIFALVLPNAFSQNAHCTIPGIVIVCFRFVARGNQLQRVGAVLIGFSNFQYPQWHDCIIRTVTAKHNLF